MRARTDAFGRPIDAAEPTARPAPDPAPAAAPREPPARRGAVLLAGALAGIVAIAGTMAFAVPWARDLPKTLAFAIAHDPFGERSLLRPDNARAGLARALEQLPRDVRIVAITIDARRISVSTREPSGVRAWIETSITGELSGHPTALAEPERGITREQLATVDVVAAVRAAHARWRALGGRIEPPMVRLEVAGGRPRGWTITFTSEVPEGERSVTIGPAGR